MARPRRPTVVRVRLTLSLDPEADADLIEFYTRIPYRYRATRTKAALRAGTAGNAEPPEQAEAEAVTTDQVIAQILQDVPKDAQAVAV